MMGASRVIEGVKGKVQVGWLVRETWEKANGRLEKGKENGPWSWAWEIWA